MILSIPSEMGYGPQGGNAQAGIGKDDTIAFYVEILAAYGVNQAGDPNAKVETDVASLPVEITGELGKPITVKVKDGVASPTEVSTTVIARGSGPEIGGEGSNFTSSTRCLLLIIPKRKRAMENPVLSVPRSDADRSSMVSKVSL